jgi:hypothetical protein
LSFFNFSAKDDWKIDNSSGVQKCGFYGNNSLILTTECRQTKDCFYWYQQVLPTNGSTACKLAVGSLGSCCPQLPNLIRMELTRIDGVGDPFEGSIVTLNCRTYQYASSSTPPTWSYQINGKGQMKKIYEINPPEG